MVKFDIDANFFVDYKTIHDREAGTKRLILTTINGSAFGLRSDFMTGLVSQVGIFCLVFSILFFIWTGTRTRYAMRTPVTTNKRHV